MASLALEKQQIEAELEDPPNKHRKPEFGGMLRVMCVFFKQKGVVCGKFVK